MAYVPFQDEEQNKPAASAGALPTTGGGSGGGQAAPAAGGAAQPAAQGANQGFANITQYLGANQDQAPQVAGSIASNLNNQYTILQGDINSAANQAGEAVKGGSTAYDQNLVSSAVSDPTKFVSDPNNLAAWQKQYQAAYTGPTAFENSANYGQAAQAANKANQTYQLGQTGGGYTQLLNQIEKNPTTGKTALDKSLIQQDPNASQTVNTALNPFKGIGDYLSGKSAEIGKQASEAAKTTGETATKTKEAAANAQSTFANDITGKLTQKNKEYQDSNNLYKDLYGVKDYQLGGDYAKKLGIGSDDLGKLYGNENILEKNYNQQFSPSDYLKFQQGNAPTKENISSPEDLARSSALSKLTGQSPFLTPGATGDPYKPSSVSYDTPAAQKALTERVNQQDQQLLQTADQQSGYQMLVQPADQKQVQAVSDVLVHGSFDKQFWPYDSGQQLNSKGIDSFKKYADAAIRQGKLKLDPNTYLPIDKTDAITPPKNPNLPPGTIGFGGTPGIY